MTNEEIISKLENIFEDVFDRKIELNTETTAKDVEGWDSLSHITLISEIEDEFDMKFSMKEVIGMKNVGEMIEIIQREI